jgi:hypothetical protein
MGGLIEDDPERPILKPVSRCQDAKAPIMVRAQGAKVPMRSRQEAKSVAILLLAVFVALACVFLARKTTF